MTNAFLKYCVFFFLFLLLQHVVAQQPDRKYEDKNLKYHIQAGLNASKLRSDTFDTESSFVPFVGIYTNGSILPKTNYRIGGGYSLRASTVLEPYGKFFYHFVDLQGAISYKAFENIRLEAGIQPSILLKAIYQAGIESTNRKAIEYNSFHTELDVFAGLEFKIQ